MKDNLKKTLSDLDTGTTDGDDGKPTLQKVEVMLALKAQDADAFKARLANSDTIARSKMANHRENLINGNTRQTTPLKKRKFIAVDGDDDDDDAVEEESTFVTKAAARQRTTMAVESIAKSMVQGGVMQSGFFKGQDGSLQIRKDQEVRRVVLDDLTLRQRKTQVLKEELDLLKIQKDLGLIDETEFKQTAKKLMDSLKAA